MDYTQRYYHRKSKVLTLVNVSPSDSGRYQCVAINKHGTFSSDFAMLIVN
ncbi:MAG: hypothetical protein GDA44_14845 [Prochloron sp. SP5CPC1]|nr:hypothetical protein [Candidatus Paraprochloron terpiosi SP5CPC1]